MDGADSNILPVDGTESATLDVDGTDENGVVDCEVDGVLVSTVRSNDDDITDKNGNYYMIPVLRGDKGACFIDLRNSLS